MNKHSSIYFLCRFPFFNPEQTPQFASFSPENSTLLFSSLLLNNKEVAESSQDLYDIYFCIDEIDREFLPLELKDAANIVWIDTKNKAQSLKLLSDKYFINYNNNLLVLPDSIGTSEQDFKKFFNLLAIDDNAVVLGKTSNDKVCSIGFNILEDNFFIDFNWDNTDFNAALSAVCKQNIHLHVINNFFMIEDVADFKKLYQELSKKDSLAYCSQQMHEKFTLLFIEYKDLLK